MKHESDFRDFLANHVNLNQSRLDDLKRHTNALTDYLTGHLEGFLGIEQQGSLALKTIIRPVKGSQECDADLLLLNELHAGQQPSQYIDNVYECLRESGRYEDMVHRKTRCVVVDYASDIHVDIVPCIEIAGYKHICNKATDQFELSDGTGYRDWFNDRNEMTNGNLKRVTRLLKFMRDHKGNFTAPSVVLTTLIGRTVDGTGEFGSIPTALHTVMTRVDYYLQSNPMMPVIINPVLPSESFNRKWDETKYQNLKTTFHIYTTKVQDAYNEPNHDQSVKIWRDIFGDDFGRLKSQAAAPTVVPARAVKPQAPWAR